MFNFVQMVALLYKLNVPDIYAISSDLQKNASPVRSVLESLFALTLLYELIFSLDPGGHPERQGRRVRDLQEAPLRRESRALAVRHRQQGPLQGTQTCIPTCIHASMHPLLFHLSEILVEPAVEVADAHPILYRLHQCCYQLPDYF
jgi:hypothetical protein